MTGAKTKPGPRPATGPQALVGMYFRREVIDDNRKHQGWVDCHLGDQFYVMAWVYDDGHPAERTVMSLGDMKGLNFYVDESDWEAVGDTAGSR